MFLQVEKLLGSIRSKQFEIRVVVAEECIGIVYFQSQGLETLTKVFLDILGGICMKDVQVNIQLWLWLWLWLWLEFGTK